ncbi:hypothetical protein GCM10022409_31970 [Hymenobacter glaciei]|uniref:CBM6 domain-containing protein n=1 Tax=Hymenobacter glaciei TaxID=877209 RepID=A0ABP7UHI6_9BACT
MTPGSSVSFTSIWVSESKAYAVDFRYAAARPFASSLSIYVNGTDVTQALFPSTNSWAAWATHTVPLNLRAGSNTVMLRHDADDNGWINLDYIQVKPAAISPGYSLGAAPTAEWLPQEVSVDKFTSTAQLYVPLHTVQANGIAVPVGLSYVASGVRVDDRGGQVGVNWGLTGGVSIRREVRGYPDDTAQTVGTETRYGWLVYPASTTPAGKIDAVPNAPSAFSATACTSSEGLAHQQLTQLGSLEPGLTNRTLFDSDQGSQFISQSFEQALLAAGCQISNYGRGRANDNAFIECLWRSVTWECVYLNLAIDDQHLYEQLHAYSTYSNHQRPHHELNGQTPAQVFAKTLTCVLTNIYLITAS